MTGEKAAESGGGANPSAASAFAVPDFSGVGSLRAMAMGTGDARLLIEAEVARVLAGHDNNPVDACKEGLARLQAAGGISGTEASQLGRVCVLLFQHQRGRLGEDATERILDIYRAIATDPRASPIAIAIASACSSYASTNRPPRSLSAATTANVNMGVAGGAIVGGLWGLGVGGPVGGALGAGLGAIVGGVVGACAGD